MAPTFIPTLLLVVLPFFMSLVIAEQHTVQFNNQCGYGTPQLIQGNDVLTTTEYTFDTSYSGIAYLQTGDCGFNGEDCGIIEMTLINPTVAGGGSSADISYIPPLAYSVPYKFEYYGGCDGTGASCNTSDCSEAFYTSDQTYVQVACQTENVNLLITFCDGNSGTSSATTEASSSTSTESATETSTTSSTFSTQVDTSSSEVVVATATSGDATSLVASPIAAAASSTPSSRRCKNRKRSPSTLSKGLRAHRRRSPSRL